MTDERTGRQVYEDFIQDQLDAEETRKTSVESRGISVITTSGTLVTALFAIAALTTGSKHFAIPSGVNGWLAAAVIAFVLAAAFALSTNVPLPYKDADPRDLQHAIETMWGDTPQEATTMTSATKVAFIERAQLINQIKGYLLMGAYTSEVIGVAFLGVAIWRVLSS